MRCTICKEETLGRDPVKWGMEFAHRTCVIAFDSGVDNERYRILELIGNDAHAMTFQSLGQYRSALMADLRSNAALSGRPKADPLEGTVMQQGEST